MKKLRELFMGYEKRDTYTLSMTPVKDDVGRSAMWNLPRKPSRAGDSASLEASKTVLDIFSPLSGRIVEVNSAAQDQPTLLNSANPAESWLVRLTDVEEGSLLGLTRSARLRRGGADVCARFGCPRFVILGQPDGTDEERFRQYRGLVNQRLPYPVSQDYLDLESRLGSLAPAGSYLSFGRLPEDASSLYLWRGDITRLAVDAIVITANSAHARFAPRPSIIALITKFILLPGVGLRLPVLI